MQESVDSADMKNIIKVAKVRQVPSKLEENTVYLNHLNRIRNEYVISISHHSTKFLWCGWNGVLALHANKSQKNEAVNLWGMWFAHREN